MRTEPMRQGRAIDKYTMAGALLVLAAASLWGTAGIAARWINEAGDTSTLAIGFWRVALAAPLLLLIAWWRHPNPGQGNYNWGRTALMGLGLAGFQIGYFGAIAAMGVALATLTTICSIPILTALLAWPVYGERVTTRLGLALLMACLGMLLVIGAGGNMVLPGDGGLRTGLPQALLGGVSFALVTLAGRSLPASQPPLWTGAFSLGIAAVTLGLGLLMTDGGWPVAGGAVWAALIWIALLPTAVAYALFYAGVRRLTSATAGLLILAEPLTANILARFLHDERLGPMGWFGAALLLSAMALATTRGPGSQDGHGRRD